MDSFLQKRGCHVTPEILWTQSCCRIWLFRNQDLLSKWRGAIADVCKQYFRLGAHERSGLVLDFLLLHGIHCVHISVKWLLSISSAQNNCYDAVHHGCGEYSALTAENTTFGIIQHQLSVKTEDFTFTRKRRVHFSQKGWSHIIPEILPLEMLENLIIEKAKLTGSMIECDTCRYHKTVSAFLHLISNTSYYFFNSSKSFSTNTVAPEQCCFALRF